jgi:hypothetical protein
MDSFDRIFEEIYEGPEPLAVPVLVGRAGRVSPRAAGR